MIEAQVFIKDVYNNAVGHDDVTAGEASAGDVTGYTITLANDSGSNLTQVKSWLDPTTENIEISANNSDWFSPIVEDSAVDFADIPANSSISFYMRRTIAAGAGSDPDVLNIVHFSYYGI